MYSQKPAAQNCLLWKALGGGGGGFRWAFVWSVFLRRSWKSTNNFQSIQYTTYKTKAEMTETEHIHTTGHINTGTQTDRELYLFKISNAWLQMRLRSVVIASSYVFTSLLVHPDILLWRTWRTFFWCTR